MSEQQELLAKISQVAGHINRHKNYGNGEVDATAFDHSSAQRHHPYVHPYTTRPARGGDSSGGFQGYGRSNTGWRPSLGAYGARGRGRGGRVLPPSHRNRTLVLNNTGNLNGDFKDAAQTSPAQPILSGTPTTGGWISKHDRHKQLINTSIYGTETMRRVKAIEDTRKLKARERDDKEKNRVLRNLQTIAVTGTTPGTASLVPDIHISGIRFRPSHDGSKLTKLVDDPHSGRSTPKKVNALGGLFLRSKNGNLYRSGLVKSKQRRTEAQKINVPCKRFTSTGLCVRGPSCRYIHNPSKVAICKDYLLKGDCPANGSCDLSHDPTPERVPACLHFLRGNCTNPECRYAHVRVNPGAPVCRAFASLGFCEKGAQCNERHVHECPNYANTGMCYDRKCRLPHIDKASQIRRNIVNLTPIDDRGKTMSTNEDEGSDISSEEEDEESGSDVDSDGLDDEPLQIFGNADNQDVAQQQDYIHF